MSEKYLLDSEENKRFLKSMMEDLIRFGQKFPSPEGASYYLGDDGTPWTDRNRETWITCRMAHVYSIGHMLGYAHCGELADCALKGLNGILHDKKNGGWYAGVTPDGEIVPGKQCYAHAFVILAATSALLANREGAKELLEEALAFYDKYFWDEEEGLACDTWNTELTIQDDYRGINANMHTVEAFLAVADATGNLRYRERAKRIIDRVIQWASLNSDRIPEHFTKDWKPDLDCNKDRPDDQFKPYGATPGHGIEWSRLISQWATASNSISDQERKEYIDAAERLYNRAISDAWNADGTQGIVYTTDWEGKPVVHDRMHWTLAEAINSSAVLYRITKNKKYLDDYANFMKYLDEKVIDHVNGSWFHQLDQNNNLLDTVWPGKSDLYHAFQATLIPYMPVNVSIAASVRKNQIDVVALGELLIDFTENGESENGNPLLEVNPGGAPCNALAMLRKYGKEVGFIGKVGQDQFGQMLKKTLTEVGINTDGLVMDNTCNTTLAFVHTTADGDRSFSFYRKPGADMMLTADEVNYEMIDRTKIFHFGSLSMTDTVAREATKTAIKYAKSKGKLISFDPNLRPPLWSSMELAKEQISYGISQCDVLKIADDEIRFMTGEDDIDKAIQVLQKDSNFKLLLVTLGKDGSIAVYNGKKVTVKGFIQENTVDTTGAGDTFCGSILNYIIDHDIDTLTEENLTEMLTLANAGASLITTKKGALKVMPEKKEIFEIVGKR